MVVGPGLKKGAGVDVNGGGGWVVPGAGGTASMRVVEATIPTAKKPSNDLSMIS